MEYSANLSALLRRLEERYVLGTLATEALTLSVSMMMETVGQSTATTLKTWNAGLAKLLTAGVAENDAIELMTLARNDVDPSAEMVVGTSNAGFTQFKVTRR